MKLLRAMLDDDAANPEVTVTSDLIWRDNSLMWMKMMYVLLPIPINITSTIRGEVYIIVLPFLSYITILKIFYFIFGL